MSGGAGSADVRGEDTGPWRAGVVTAAEMLTVAAFLQGRHAQAFPSFGSERTGAPAVALGMVGATGIEPTVSRRIQFAPYVIDQTSILR
jgi:hypothetical protein